MTDTPQPASRHSHLDPADRYKVGTLQYTKAGLMMVFFWLLWGDFTFTLMEGVIPSILPLKLRELGAPNLAISLILGTIPNAMNFLINPIVSFRSDRSRHRLGRRIPFLLFATPFIALVLAAMAFAPEIGQWVHAHGGQRLASVSPLTFMVATVGVLMVMFQFFNMFIATVYYYLINDVVPEHFLARFCSLFRVVGTAASMAYNYFIFQHALTHTRAIFIGVGLLYLAVFLLMCWRVKEGKYPPPLPLDGNRKGIVASARTYFRECFTQRYYLCIFLGFACLGAAQACNFVWNLFFLHLGISLEQLGKLATYFAIPSMLLTYAMGSVADRVHPIRLVLGSLLALAVTSIAGFFVVHGYWSNVGLGLIWTPVNIALGAGMGPLLMLLFPKDRYGQFGSANAMVSSITMLIMSILAGLFMDWLKKLYGGNEEYYRWVYIWHASFEAAAFLLMWRVYRYWKALGGDAYYAPPPVGPPAGRAN